MNPADFEAVATPGEFPSRAQWLKRAGKSYPTLWLAHVFFTKEADAMASACAVAPEVFMDVLENIREELRMSRNQTAFLEPAEIRLSVGLERATR